MHHTSPDMQDCIQNCLNCYATCTAMAYNHCLTVGGEHTEPNHFRLMEACAQMCKTSAHLMLIGYDNHPAVCKVCADICTACADDCERVGDMDECVKACRTCAQSCAAMAA